MNFWPVDVVSRGRSEGVGALDISVPYKLDRYVVYFFPNYHGQCASACNLVGLLGVLACNLTGIGAFKTRVPLSTSKENNRL